MFDPNQDSSNPALPITTYLQQILEQLKVQAGGVTETEGIHPDPAIRQFNLGLLAYLNNGAHFDFLLALAEVYRQKLASKTVDPGHFVDLIARAVQYLERQKGASSYVPFTAEDWLNYFDDLSQVDLQNLVNVMVEKQISTHILSRYRGLSALGVMAQKKFQQPLRIADIGCSLNFGLPLALQPATILTKVLPMLETDATPDAFLTNLLKTSQVDYDHAIGIDLNLPDKAWVAACGYFSNYDEQLAHLNAAEKLLADLRRPVLAKNGDVTNSELTNLVKNSAGELPHIIHASMCLYQVSIKDYLLALEVIAQSLPTEGVFIELTFREPKIWFKPWNVQTLIRFKQPDGQLSPAAEWLVWKNSRCGEVKPGGDFEVVNQRMNLSI